MPADPPRFIGPRFIAIASGKGGVGKTWLAITLSHALIRAGRRVLLLDADLGLANVDVQLGLTPLTDLGSVLSGRTNVVGAITRHEATGLDVLAGRSGSGTLAELSVETLELLLTRLRTELAGYDVVVLDLSAGIDRIVRRVAMWSDLLLVVATDEPTSLTDAYAVLKLQTQDQPDGDVRIVVNQAQSVAAGQQTYATLRRACMAFLHREPPLAGVIRHDPKIRDAIRRQTSLLLRHPNCAAAQDVEALARTCLMPQGPLA
jgi:flagellar biosynthesis protein FlhG